MPTKCSVSGCENFYSKRVPFFDVPSPLKYKFCSEKAELSKKRRKKWLEAIGVTNTPTGVLRICSKHFVTGKPAPLEKSSDVDWVPTLYTKLGSSSRKNHRKESKDDRRTKKESISSSRSRKSIKKIPKKVDVKKLRNCKVLLNGNLQCTTFRGTNGSGLTLAQKHGYFTSDNVTVKETAINNTILRIHLLREDLDDLKRNNKSDSPNRIKRKNFKTSSFGRQIKRKSDFFEESLGLIPSRKATDRKTVANTKISVSNIEKPEKQMRNRIEKEKSRGVISKFQSRHDTPRLLSEKAILQKAIQKSFRDRIKIKLFPKGAAPIKKAFKNGNLDPNLEKTVNIRKGVIFAKNEPQWTYYLKFTPLRYPQDGTLDYSFQKLVTDVKHMKLPSPSWKIKVIIKQSKISAITFTNKLSLERCVGFSANNDKYKITIDNKPALLLGSPEKVRTSEDLEILLDIVQNIDSDNPMIFYK